MKLNLINYVVSRGVKFILSISASNLLRHFYMFSTHRLKAPPDLLL